MEADAAGALRKNQKDTAAARLLLVGLGTVGIIALVDEAAGY